MPSKLILRTRGSVETLRKWILRVVGFPQPLIILGMHWTTKLLVSLRMHLPPELLVLLRMHWSTKLLMNLRMHWSTKVLMSIRTPMHCLIVLRMYISIEYFQAFRTKTLRLRSEVVLHLCLLAIGVEPLLSHPVPLVVQVVLLQAVVPGVVREVFRLRVGLAEPEV